MAPGQDLNLCKRGDIPRNSFLFSFKLVTHEFNVERVFRDAQ